MTSTHDPRRDYRASRCRSRLPWRAGCRLAIAIAVTGLHQGRSALALAQDWNPFSQLETNRWEQRSQPSRRKSVPPDPPTQTYEDSQAGPTGTRQGDYLEPPDQLPRFGEPPQTYYPKPRSSGSHEPVSHPVFGALRSAPLTPTSISAEPLAPLPAGTPADAGPVAGPSAGYAARRPGQVLGQDAAPIGYTGIGETGRQGEGFPPARSYPTSPAPFAPADPAVRQPASGPAGRTNSNGLPFGLWRGLDLPTLERLIASLQIPPRSISLQDQWRRLLIADVPPPTDGNAYAHFQALRLEALYRSGLARETDEVLAANRAGSADDPLIAMLAARSQIGAGRRKEGCDTAKRMQNIRREIPKSLRGEAILVSGYCAASSGNKPAAGLLAELAREEGLKPSPGLAALDAVALGVRTDLSLPQGQKLSLIDYRILELGGATPEAGELVQVAAPPLLVAVANDPAGKPDLRLAAGEAAARINAYALEDLAVLYRTAIGKMELADAPPLQSTANGTDTPKRRALLYASAKAERTPFKKVRMIRAFIDSAKRADLYLSALIIAAKLTDDVGLVPEISWFAETAIEANLAAANYERARMWAKFAASIDNGRGQNLDHWMALIDIADPHFPGRRGESLVALERLALMGRFSSENLNRLATVLDALEYNVPIPLWETANRTTQPSTGHLPETGVLTELQDAAKKREFGRTVLLAMQTLGADGPDGAHMIALGDAIRALKHAGLESDARRLGFEALLPGWPRVVTN